MPSYSGYRQNYSDLFFTPEYNQYVAPVDLAEYAKTFDTLQQRHDNAVVLESKYKEELSKLDLNPAESGFISNLAASLSSELDANSNYGNLGFGINNMIRRYGNIMFNQGLQGRLDAQRDWKAYNAKLEANQTLDEDTKAYYIEKNKYYYNPRFDKNGNELKGEAWQPIEREVDGYNFEQLLVDGIKFAAEDSGAGNQTRFLDANGNVTDNPFQAVGGEVFSTTTNSWEKLSQQKIRDGVIAAYKSNPAARAAFDQYYKVQKWKYDKGENSAVTDSNGILLDKDEVFDDMFREGIRAASYNRYKSITDYSNAAKAKEALLKANEVSVPAQSGSGYVNDLLSNGVDPSVYTNTMKIDFNIGADILQAKTNATLGLASILGMNIDENQYTNFISELENADSAKLDSMFEQAIANMPEANKDIARRKYEDYKRQYFSAVADYDAQVRNLPQNVRASLDFLNNVEAGNGFVKGRSNEDDTALSLVEQIFGDGEYIDLIVNGDGNNNQLKAKFQNNFESGTTKDGNTYYRLYRKDYNKIYQFAQGLDIFDTRNWFYSAFTEPINIRAYDKDGNDVTRVTNRTQGTPSSLAPNITASNVSLDGLRSLRDLISRTKEDLKANNFFTGTIESSVIDTGANTGRDLYERQRLNSGIISMADYKAIRDVAIEPHLQKLLTNPNLTQGQLWFVDENNNTFVEEVSPKKRLKYSQAISAAYKTNPNRVNVQVGFVSKSGKGYYEISYPEGDVMKHVLVDPFNDPVLEQINTSDDARNLRTLSQLTATSGTRTLITDDFIPGFGNHRLKANGNDTFVYSINGVDLNVIDINQANRLLTSLNEFFKINRDTDITSLNSLNTASQQSLINQINRIATEIYKSCGGQYSPEVIGATLVNKLFNQ